MQPQTADLVPRLRARLGDAIAGGICSVLSIAFALSYAALIFSGPLSQWLDGGVAVAFTSAAVLAAVMALGSSVPIVIAGPDSSTSAVAATLAASLAERLIASAPAADLFTTTAITLAVVTAMTGCFMIVMGLLRGGRAFRYVPYPVIGGFLGATGWLVVSGAVRVVTGVPLEINFASISDLLTSKPLLAAIGFAVAIGIAMSRLRSAYTLPIMLAGGAVAAHFGLSVAGLSIAEAQAEGWLFAPQHAPFSLPWHELGHFSMPWNVLPALAGDALALVLVTALSSLVNTTGIEVALMREANMERELKVTGLANLAAAALGGFVGCASVTRTVLNKSAGATGRLSGLTVAVVIALVVAAAPGLIGYLPKFVLGGLLLYLGADQLHRWLVGSWPRLSRSEYVALVTIIVITVKLGFVWGLGIGTVIGCATFAVSASRVDSIKFEFDGSELRSSLDRAPADLMVLAAHGREILGLNLQSYLFFGSANRLYRHVKARVAANPRCRYLLFDFRLVTGIDSSATYSFVQIRNYVAERGIRLVFVHLPVSVEKALRAETGLLTGAQLLPDLDHALEWSENEVIRTHRAAAEEEGDLRAWFAEVLGDADRADELLRHCSRIEVAPGSVIARAGEEARSMYFILEGRIGVMVETGEPRSTRVRSLGRHTMVGEMGLLAGQPRSATLKAETASILYQLDADAFHQLKTHAPQLVERLLSYVVTVLAERLAFANRSIGVLRR